MELLNYCKSLPKVELHAHLNGSLSDATVLNLMSAREQMGADFSSASAEVTIKKGHQRTMEECFQVFRILHSLTDNLEAVRTITQDVIQEFASDNVKYLELRTTPKNIPNKMTKKEYMDAVLQATVEAMKKINIKVCLLLSIDRARGVEDAWSTLQLAKEYLTHEWQKALWCMKDVMPVQGHVVWPLEGGLNVFGPLVCGLDVSGNPHSGDLKDYLPVLQEAQKCGLKLAVHLAEVPNDTETLTVLNSGWVDRIGHGTFIHPDTGGSKELHTIVKERKLPLEICVSSNIKSGTVKNANNHHLDFWRKENHPLTICTDDKGVFSTSLSEEFVLCAETFSLSEDDLHTICLSGVDAAFLPQVEKQRLRQEVQKELDSLKGKLAHQ